MTEVVRSTYACIICMSSMLVASSQIVWRGLGSTELAVIGAGGGNKLGSGQKGSRIGYEAINWVTHGYS